MKIYYPALTTSAIFFALLILDLANHKAKLFVVHLIFSIIAVLLMSYLSQIDLDFVAWGILSIPLAMVLVGLLIGFYNSEPGTVIVAPAIAPTPPRCNKRPCVCNLCNTPIAAPITTPVAAPITDISGSPIVTTPPALTTCGTPGRTQCIDVNSLTSV